MPFIIQKEKEKKRNIKLKKIFKSKYTITSCICDQLMY